MNFILPFAIATAWSSFAGVPVPSMTRTWSRTKTGLLQEQRRLRQVDAHRWLVGVGHRVHPHVGVARERMGELRVWPGRKPGPDLKRPPAASETRPPHSATLPSLPTTPL